MQGIPIAQKPGDNTGTLDALIELLEELQREKRSVNKGMAGGPNWWNL